MTVSLRLDNAGWWVEVVDQHRSAAPQQALIGEGPGSMSKERAQAKAIEEAALRRRFGRVGVRFDIRAVRVDSARAILEATEGVVVHGSRPWDDPADAERWRATCGRTDSHECHSTYDPNTDLSTYCPGIA